MTRQTIVKGVQSTLKAQLEVSVYLQHILYIILTYYLVRFRNSNFMYKLCTRRVVGVCVAWSAYIKEKTTHILCVLYILALVFEVKDCF